LLLGTAATCFDQNPSPSSGRYPVHRCTKMKFPGSDSRVEMRRFSRQFRDWPRPDHQSSTKPAAIPRRLRRCQSLKCRRTVIFLRCHLPESILLNFVALKASGSIWRTRNLKSHWYTSHSHTHTHTHTHTHAIVIQVADFSQLERANYLNKYIYKLLVKWKASYTAHPPLDA